MPFSLRETSRRLRAIRPGKSVVLAGGTFDIIHLGHVRYLERCRKLGDILVVCVAGDRRTRRRKGKNRPLKSAVQRAEIVQSLKMVDLAFVSDLKPFSETILQAIKPDVVVTTPNEPSGEVKHQFLNYMKHKHPEVRVRLIPRSQTGTSSSKLINTLKDRNRRVSPRN